VFWLCIGGCPRSLFGSDVPLVASRPDWEDVLAQVLVSGPVVAFSTPPGFLLGDSSILSAIVSVPTSISDPVNAISFFFLWFPIGVSCVSYFFSSQFIF
jgi:hypothetical protein